MEGRHFGEGTPNIEKEKHDPKQELQHLAEMTQESIDAAQKSSDSADTYLEKITDPERRKHLLKKIEELRTRKNKLGDPKEIAERMVDVHGEEFFEKKESEDAN